jgi:hypothetical protein
MANPQPPAVNYNEVRTLWTEEECFYLLDQRMSRNDEFWRLTRKRRFWKSIANKINECFGTRFSGVQVDQKWRNLNQAYLVSTFIFYVN